MDDDESLERALSNFIFLTDAPESLRGQVDNYDSGGLDTLAVYTVGGICISILLKKLYKRLFSYSGIRNRIQLRDFNKPDSCFPSFSKMDIPGIQSFKNVMPIFTTGYSPQSPKMISSVNPSVRANSSGRASLIRMSPKTAIRTPRINRLTPQEVLQSRSLSTFKVTETIKPKQMSQLRNDSELKLNQNSERSNHNEVIVISQPNSSKSSHNSSSHKKSPLRTIVPTETLSRESINPVMALISKELSAVDNQLPKPTHPTAQDCVSERCSGELSLFSFQRLLHSPEKLKPSPANTDSVMSQVDELINSNKRSCRDSRFDGKFPLFLTFYSSYSTPKKRSIFSKSNYKKKPNQSSPSKTPSHSELIKDVNSCDQVIPFPKEDSKVEPLKMSEVSTQLFKLTPKVSEICTKSSTSSYLEERVQSKRSNNELNAGTQFDDDKCNTRMRNVHDIVTSSRKGPTNKHDSGLRLSSGDITSEDPGNNQQLRTVKGDDKYPCDLRAADKETFNLLPHESSTTVKIKAATRQYNGDKDTYERHRFMKKQENIPVQEQAKKITLRGKSDKWNATRLPTTPPQKANNILKPRFARNKRRLHSHLLRNDMAVNIEKCKQPKQKEQNIRFESQRKHMSPTSKEHSTRFTEMAHVPFIKQDYKHAAGKGHGQISYKEQTSKQAKPNISLAKRKSRTDPNIISLSRERQESIRMVESLPSLNETDDTGISDTLAFADSSVYQSYASLIDKPVIANEKMVTTKTNSPNNELMGACGDQTYGRNEKEDHQLMDCNQISHESFSRRDTVMPTVGGNKGDKHKMDKKADKTKCFEDKSAGDNSDYPMALDNLIRNRKNYIQNTRLLCNSSKCTMYEQLNVLNPQGPGSVRACKGRSTTAPFPTLMSFLYHIEKVDQERNDSLKHENNTQKLKKKAMEDNQGLVGTEEKCSATGSPEQVISRERKQHTSAALNGGLHFGTNELKLYSESVESIDSMKENQKPKKIPVEIQETLAMKTARALLKPNQVVTGDFKKVRATDHRNWKKDALKNMKKNLNEIVGKRKIKISHKDGLPNVLAWKSAGEKSQRQNYGKAAKKCHKKSKEKLNSSISREIKKAGFSSPDLARGTAHFVKKKVADTGHSYGTVARRTSVKEYTKQKLNTEHNQRLLSANWDHESIAAGKRSKPTKDGSSTDKASISTNVRDIRKLSFNTKRSKLRRSGVYKDFDLSISKSGLFVDKNVTTPVKKVDIDHRDNVIIRKVSQDKTQRDFSTAIQQSVLSNAALKNLAATSDLGPHSSQSQLSLPSGKPLSLAQRHSLQSKDTLDEKLDHPHRKETSKSDTRADEQQQMENETSTTTTNPQAKLDTLHSLSSSYTSKHKASDTKGKNLQSPWRGTVAFRKRLQHLLQHNKELTSKHTCEDFNQKKQLKVISSNSQTNKEESLYKVSQMPRSFFPHKTCLKNPSSINLKKIINAEHLGGNIHPVFTKMGIHDKRKKTKANGKIFQAKNTAAQLIMKRPGIGGHRDMGLVGHLAASRKRVAVLTSPQTSTESHKLVITHSELFKQTLQSTATNRLEANEHKLQRVQTSSKGNQVTEATQVEVPGKDSHTLSLKFGNMSVATNQGVYGSQYCSEMRPDKQKKRRLEGVSMKTNSPDIATEGTQTKPRATVTTSSPYTQQGHSPSTSKSEGRSDEKGSATQKPYLSIEHSSSQAHTDVCQEVPHRDFISGPEEDRHLVEEESKAIDIQTTMRSGLSTTENNLQQLLDRIKMNSFLVMSARRNKGLPFTGLSAAFAEQSNEAVTSKKSESSSSQRQINISKPFVPLQFVNDVTDTPEHTKSQCVTDETAPTTHDNRAQNIVKGETPSVIAHTQVSQTPSNHLLPDTHNKASQENKDRKDKLVALNNEASLEIMHQHKSLTLIHGDNNIAFESSTSQTPMVSKTRTSHRQSQVGTNSIVIIQHEGSRNICECKDKISGSNVKHVAFQLRSQPSPVTSMPLVAVGSVVALHETRKAVPTKASCVSNTETYRQHHTPSTSTKHRQPNVVCHTQDPFDSIWSPDSDLQPSPDTSCTAEKHQSTSTEEIGKSPSLSGHNTTEVLSLTSLQLLLNSQTMKREISTPEFAQEPDPVSIDKQKGGFDYSDQRILLQSFIQKHEVNEHFSQSISQTGSSPWKNLHFLQSISQTASPWKKNLHMDAIPEEGDFESVHNMHTDVNDAEVKSGDLVAAAHGSEESGTGHRTDAVTENLLYKIEIVTVPNYEKDESALKIVTMPNSEDKSALKIVTMPNSEKDKGALKIVTMPNSEKDKSALKIVTMPNSEDKSALKIVTMPNSEDKSALKIVTMPNSEKDKGALKIVTMPNSEDKSALGVTNVNKSEVSHKNNKLKRLSSHTAGTDDKHVGTARDKQESGVLKASIIGKFHVAEMSKICGTGFDFKDELESSVDDVADRRLPTKLGDTPTIKTIYHSKRSKDAPREATHKLGDTLTIKTVDHSIRSKDAPREATHKLGDTLTIKTVDHSIRSKDALREATHKLGDTLTIKTVDHSIRSKDAPREATQTVTNTKHKDRHRMQTEKRKHRIEHDIRADRQQMTSDSKINVDDLENSAPKSISSRAEKVLLKKIDVVELEPHKDEGQSSHLNAGIDSTVCDVHLSLTRESGSKGSVFSGLHTDSVTHAKAVDLGELSPNLSSPDTNNTDRQILTNDSMTRLDCSEPPLSVGRNKSDELESTKKGHKAPILQVPSQDKVQPAASQLNLPVDEQVNKCADQTQKIITSAAKHSTVVGYPLEVHKNTESSNTQEASGIVNPSRSTEDKEKSEDECTSDSISELIKKINSTLRARSISLCKVGTHNSRLFPENILCLSKSDKKGQKVICETEKTIKYTDPGMAAKKETSDVLPLEQPQVSSRIKQALSRSGSDVCESDKPRDLQAGHVAEEVAESALASTIINEVTSDEPRPDNGRQQHPPEKVCHSNRIENAEKIVDKDERTVAQERIISKGSYLQSTHKRNNKQATDHPAAKHSKAELREKIATNGNDDLESLLNKELSLAKITGSARQCHKTNQLFSVAGGRAGQRRKRKSWTQTSSSQVSGQSKLHSSFLRENDGSLTCISSNTSQLTCSPSEATTIHNSSRHVKPLAPKRYAKLEEFLQKVEVISRAESMTKISKTMSRLSSFTSVTPSSQEDEQLLPLLTKPTRRYKRFDLRPPPAEAIEHKCEVLSKVNIPSLVPSQSAHSKLLSLNSEEKLEDAPEKQQAENNKNTDNETSWSAQFRNQTNSHQNGDRFHVVDISIGQSNRLNIADLDYKNDPTVVDTYITQIHRPEVCRKNVDVKTRKCSRVTDSIQQSIKTTAMQDTYQRQEKPLLEMRTSQMDSLGVKTRAISNYQHSTRSSANSLKLQMMDESSVVSTSSSSSSIVLSWIGSDIEETEANLANLSEHYTNISSDVYPQSGGTYPTTTFSEKALKLSRTHQAFDERDYPPLSTHFTELLTSATTDARSSGSFNATLNDMTMGSTKGILSRTNRESDAANIYVHESEDISRMASSNINHESWKTCSPFQYTEEPHLDSQWRHHMPIGNTQATSTKDAKRLSSVADVEAAETGRGESRNPWNNYPGNSACTLDQPSYFSALLRTPRWNPSFDVKDDKYYPQYNEQPGFIDNYVQSAFTYQNTRNASPSLFSAHRDQYDSSCFTPLYPAQQPVQTNGQPAQTNGQPAQTNGQPSRTNSKTAQTSSQPARTNSQPSRTSSKIAQTSSQPARTNSQPSRTSSKEAQTSSQPAQTNSQPSRTNSKTAQTSSQPARTSSQPSRTSSQPAQRNAARAVSSPSSIKSNEDLQSENCPPHPSTSHPLQFWHMRNQGNAKHSDTLPNPTTTSALHHTKQENKQNEVKKLAIDFMARCEEKQNSFLRKVHFNNKSQPSGEDGHPGNGTKDLSQFWASYPEVTDRPKERATLYKHLKASSKSGTMSFKEKYNCKQHSKSTDSTTVRSNMSLEQHLCLTLDSDKNKAKTNVAQSASDNGTAPSTSSHASLNWYKPQSLPSSTSVSNGNTAPHPKETTCLPRPQLSEPEPTVDATARNTEHFKSQSSQRLVADSGEKVASYSLKNTTEKVSVQRSLKFVHVVQSGTLTSSVIPDTEMGFSESISTHSSTSEYDTNKRQPPGFRRFRKSVTNRLTRQALPPFPFGYSRVKGHKPSQEFISASSSSKDESKQTTTSELTASLSKSQRATCDSGKAVDNLSTKRSRSLVSSFHKLDIRKPRMTETSRSSDSVPVLSMKASEASSDSRSNQSSGHPRGDGESLGAAVIETRLGKKRSRRTTHDPIAPEPHISQQRDPAVSLPHRAAKRVSRLVEMFEKKCEG